MNAIKASDLQAAVSLTAALVLNDGKYEQWQKLFGKALNDATGLKWKDNGWSEFSPPRGKNAAPIHRLTFASSKPSVELIVSFDETVTGYIFLNALVAPKGQYTSAISASSVSSGKDLLAAIVKLLTDKGAISAPAEPSTAPAAAPSQKIALQSGKVIQEEMKYLKIKIGGTGSVPALFTPVGVAVKKLLADGYAEVPAEDLYENIIKQTKLSPMGGVYSTRVFRKAGNLMVIFLNNPAFGERIMLFKG